MKRREFLRNGAYGVARIRGAGRGFAQVGPKIQRYGYSDDRKDRDTDQPAGDGDRHRGRVITRTRPSLGLRGFPRCC